MTFTPKKLSNTDDAGPVTFGRLLLAKQLFLHASEHAKLKGWADKIIAVHNFHNSIEVALKAVAYWYEITNSKAYNVDFGTLIKDIDDHFKADGVQLPYRQDLTNLNSYRNLAQHNATEPPAGMMEEWRVITDKFLRRTFEDYFALEFDRLTRLALVQDDTLRDLLALAVQAATGGQARSSLDLARFAMYFAITSCIKLPSFYNFSATAGYYADGHYRSDELPEMQTFNSFVGNLADWVGDEAVKVALLERGINSVDYRRFLQVTPEIGVPPTVDTWFEADGTKVAPDAAKSGLPNMFDYEPAEVFEFGTPTNTLGAFWNERRLEPQQARWAAEFAIDTIVSLQGFEPAPKVLHMHAEIAAELVRTKGESGRYGYPANTPEVND